MIDPNIWHFGTYILNTIRLIWTFSVHYIHLRITKLAKSILFADDFTMYNSSPDIHIINRNWPIEGPDWFRTNNLSLNVSKINCVMFCLKINSKVQGGGGVPSNTTKMKWYKRLMIGLYMGPQTWSFSHKLSRDYVFNAVIWSLVLIWNSLNFYMVDDLERMWYGFHRVAWHLLSSWSTAPHVVMWWKPNPFHNKISQRQSNQTNPSKQTSH